MAAEEGVVVKLKPRTVYTYSQTVRYTKTVGKRHLLNSGYAGVIPLKTACGTEIREPIGDIGSYDNEECGPNDCRTCWKSVEVRPLARRSNPPA
jgi:hypothetical protein